MGRKRSSSAPAVDPDAPETSSVPLPTRSQPDAAPRQPPIFVKGASELTEDGVNTVSPAPRPVHNPGNDDDSKQNWYDYFKKTQKGAGAPWRRGSSVGWHDKWDDHDWSNGRVLIIDYCAADGGGGASAGAAKTRIRAQEVGDFHGLHKYYVKDRGRGGSDAAALRVVHVQNAPWAVQYLTRKYNIDAAGEAGGSAEMDFAKWARYSRPEWRAGKPLLKGRTWRTQRNPWRGVRCTAFGLDYLAARDVRVDDDAGSSHQANSVAARGSAARGRDDYKMMEMNCYDDADAPSYGWDVAVKRLSVYVQYKDGERTAPDDDDDNPYAMPYKKAKVPYKDDLSGKCDDTTDEKGQANGKSATGKTAEDKANGEFKHKFPPLHFLDNGNTIIIFENSHTGSVSDTLIGARQQMENRWRRLSFFLPPRELGNESRLALELMDLILEDIFKGLAVCWEHFLGIAETHVSILEDKIYDSPADESRAPELWYNSSTWLKVERLAFIHLECVKELITQLGDLAIFQEDGKPWLEGVVDQYEKLTTLVQEDLVKPTANLSDLMYKSVGIRDSRQSLGLSTSMWRLSWITFIFLPLSVLVGFFGMNVDTFQDNPSIKWYFIAAVPLMVLVVILWYVLKHALASRHQTPYQRGVYEHMFHDLAVAHPDLWSRSGPRRGMQPIGWWNSVRWWLLKRWFDPRRTIAKPPSDPDEDVGGSGLGAWARTKRSLARQWLGSIKATRRASISESEEGLIELPAMDALIAASTPVAAAEVPETQKVTKQNLERLSPRGRRGRSFSPRISHRPSSSGDSSGVMLDERIVGEGNVSSRGRSPNEPL